LQLSDWKRDVTPHRPAFAAVEAIATRILVLRGQRVLVDADLAALYGVSTRRLNEQVKRNRKRFPGDFVFRLNAAETKTLDRSQFATGSQKHRNPRFPPYAFTEHGAIMAAMVLNSARATDVSVYVVRAFVELRGVLAANKELAKRLDQLEATIEKRLARQDEAVAEILVAIRNLMAPAQPMRRPIGFVTPEEKKGG
jgi:ATP-dependent Clp protease ATP-binding subunit ClpA